MTDNALTRMNDIETAAKAFFTGRVIKRSLLQHYDNHAAGEIEQGVIMMVSRGESEYNNGLGMVAKEGTQSILFVGHIKVADNLQPSDVEIAECTLMEEIKSFLKQGVTGMSLKPERIDQSQQLSHPYGWVVAKLRAEPPQQGTY